MKTRLVVNQFFIVFVSLLFISCGDSSEETPIEAPVQDTSIHYGNAAYKLPQLSEKAQEQTIRWSVFEDFENEMKLINGANIETLLSSTDRLLKFSDSLSKTVPETLNDKAIVSRLIVAKTRAGLLHQELRLSKLDSTEIQKSIKNLNIATSNLFTRINEKYTKAAIDFERKENEEAELKKQKKFLDSVYQAELRDKNN